MEEGITEHFTYGITQSGSNEDAADNTDKAEQFFKETVDDSFEP